MKYLGETIWIWNNKINLFGYFYYINVEEGLEYQKDHRICKLEGKDKQFSYLTI